MYIRYEFIGDEIILHIPDTAVWEFKQKMISEKGYDDYGIYLIINGEERLIKDTDFWCSGRPNLSQYAVGDLYTGIIDEITSMIVNNQNLSYINIDEIESKLLSEKYEKIWIEKGYVTCNENGEW